MRVAVIDIGSNSIKMLVAQRGADGKPIEVLSRAIEARISRGISAERPRLEEKAIESVIRVVASLAAEARALGVENPTAVATSAVRDASNGPDFREQLKAKTGIELRILSGLDEAALIGRGLSTDPALAAVSDFDIFDLGGGSLECLALRGRTVESAVSLPLGCVRLTERFVADPARPLSDASAKAICAHVRAALLASGFPFPVPGRVRVVGTGGTLATVRAMAGEGGAPLAPESATLPVALLERILGRVGPLALEDRKKIEGLSPARADVFPAALVTVLTLAEVGRFDRFQYSLRNLRWGLAAQALAG